MEEADRERQQIRSDLQSHEDICAERYKAIQSAYDDVKTQLKEMGGDIKLISSAQIANAAVAAAAITSSQPKWWMRLLFAAALALFGWMASTIWSMEAAKVDAAQNRPATQVTVQPALSAPVQPIAQPTAPAPGTPPSALSDDPPN